MSAMRAFIALCVPEQARAAAREYQDRWRGLWPGGAVSWTPESAFHLTLRFLGEIEEKVADRIAGRLETLADGAPLPCSFAGPLGFPTLRRPHILGLKVAGPPGLGALADDLDRALHGLGLERRDKPFRPHLTLGRVRDKRIAVPAEPEFGTGEAWEATRVVLFRSELSPAGSRYTELAVVTLSGRLPAGS